MKIRSMLTRSLVSSRRSKLYWATHWDYCRSLGLLSCTSCMIHRVIIFFSGSSWEAVMAPYGIVISNCNRLMSLTLTSISLSTCLWAYHSHLGRVRQSSDASFMRILTLA